MWKMPNGKISVFQIYMLVNHNTDYKFDYRAVTDY